MKRHHPPRRSLTTPGKDHVVNTAVTRPTAKQIEDAAAEVHARVRQVADHAEAGDWRRAHAAAEQAQGAARRLKELLGAAAAQPGNRADIHPHR